MKSIKAATYYIHFKQNGYRELNTLIQNKNYSSIFILVDENTLECCYPKFIPLLETDKRIEIIEIESGEINKNLDTCNGVWNALTELNADRNSLLITLDGGVITDLGGFVAATYKRGIDFVNIPTTLLSMVDASVGGKTGVDLGVLKNQVGLFVNPKTVIIDEDFLATLEDREYRSGVAEIIKYGLTHDTHLIDDLKTFEKSTINKIIHRSIEIKNEIVFKDPKEQGLRKVLNFGHTLGHAIESYFLGNNNKDNLTHGEAIAIGMVCESYLSYKVLKLPIEKLSVVKNMISTMYEKVTIEKDDYAAIFELLKHDKKNNNGEVNFVLLNDFEEFKLDCKISIKLLIESIEYYNS